MLRFATKTEDEVEADAAHPLTFRFSDAGEPAPYIHVRADRGQPMSWKTRYQFYSLDPAAA